jgi:hypothetical protein
VPVPGQVWGHRGVTGSREHQGGTPWLGVIPTGARSVGQSSAVFGHGGAWAGETACPTKTGHPAGRGISRRCRNSSDRPGGRSHSVEARA